MAASMLPTSEKSDTARPTMPTSDMQLLERAAQLAQQQQEYDRKQQQQQEQEQQQQESANPDEISLDDVEEPEDVVEEMSIPKEIFERNVPTNGEKPDKEKSSLGALARLKRKQAEQ